MEDGHERVICRLCSVYVLTKFKAEVFAKHLLTCKSSTAESRRAAALFLRSRVDLAESAGIPTNAGPRTLDTDEESSMRNVAGDGCLPGSANARGSLHMSTLAATQPVSDVTSTTPSSSLRADKPSIASAYTSRPFTSVSAGAKRRLTQSHLRVDSATAQDCLDLRKHIAEFIVQCGLPKDIVERPGFRLFLSRLRPALALPCRSTVNKDVRAYLTRVSDVKKKLIESSSSVVLCVDGKRDCARRHLTGFTACVPHPLFLHAAEIEQFSENAAAIAEKMSAAIHEVGAGKVTAIVTDNAAVMLAATSALKALDQTFRHIIPVGCCAHAMNLVIKDVVAKIPVFKTCVEVCNKISSTINNSNLHKVFVSLQKADGIERALRIVVETRWLSSFECVRRVYCNRPYIQRLVDAHPQSNLKDYVVYATSDDFFEQCRGFLVCTAPLIDLLLFCERDEPGFSSFLPRYHETQSVLAIHSHSLTDGVYDQVIAFLTTRFNNLMFRKEMELAVALDFTLDRMQWDEWVSEKDCLNQCLEYGASLGMEADNVLDEWISFASSRGHSKFGKDSALIERAICGSTGAREFWAGVGTHKWRNLSNIAQRLLSIFLSSASIERVWKKYSYVQDDYRARLEQGHASELVAAYANFPVLCEHVPEQLGLTSEVCKLILPSHARSARHRRSQVDLTTWLSTDMGESLFDEGGGELVADMSLDDAVSDLAGDEDASLSDNLLAQEGGSLADVHRDVDSFADMDI